MNNITDYQIFQRDLLLPVVLSCNRASGGNHRQQLLRGIPRPGFLDKPKCTGNKYHRKNYNDGKRSHILRCMLKDRYNNIGKNRYDCQAEQNCGKWIDKRPCQSCNKRFFLFMRYFIPPKSDPMGNHRLITQSGQRSIKLLQNRFDFIACCKGQLFVGLIPANHIRSRFMNRDLVLFLLIHWG